MASTEYTVLTSSMGQVIGKGSERSRTDIDRGGTIKLESNDDRTKRFLALGIIAKGKDVKRDAGGRVIGATALSILRKGHTLRGDRLEEVPEEAAVEAPEGGVADFSAEEGTEAGDQAANEAAMAAVVGDNV